MEQARFRGLLKMLMVGFVGIPTFVAHAAISVMEASSIAHQYVQERSDLMSYQDADFVDEVVDSESGRPGYYFTHVLGQDNRECLFNVIIDNQSGEILTSADLALNEKKYLVRTNSDIDCSTVDWSDAGKVATKYIEGISLPFAGFRYRRDDGGLNRTGSVQPGAVWEFNYRGAGQRADETCSFSVLVSYYTGEIVASVWRRHDGNTLSTSEEWVCQTKEYDGGGYF
jgi:hypothetical protein